MALKSTLFALAVLSFLADSHTLPVKAGQRQRQIHGVMRKVPEPDGMLHMYMLPVGQGDAHVIQCPSGDLTLMDWGSSENANAGFWHIPELQAFLQGQFNRIHNLILSHNHYDHYSFISAVLDPDTADMSGLVNIYGTCLYDDMVAAVKNWTIKVGPEKVRLFNNGNMCGPVSRFNPDATPCETIDLCPNDPEVIVKTMAVNSGQQCRNQGGNRNPDSIVFKVTYGTVSIMFNGDFEDVTNNQTENGPQRWLVDYYGDEMKATIYKVSHHGAETLANKNHTRFAHQPKATFVSNNPWYSNYFHPRCNINDRLIDTVQSICRPQVQDVAHPQFCSVHPYGNLEYDQFIQSLWTCGYTNQTRRTWDDNDWAIYSTTPDSQTMNLVELVVQHVNAFTTNWGFVNNFMPKLVRSEPLGFQPMIATDEEIHACSGHLND